MEGTLDKYGSIYPKWREIMDNPEFIEIFADFIARCDKSRAIRIKLAPHEFHFARLFFDMGFTPRSISTYDMDIVIPNNSNIPPAYTSCNYAHIIILHSNMILTKKGSKFGIPGGVICDGISYMSIAPYLQNEEPRLLAVAEFPGTRMAETHFIYVINVMTMEDYDGCQWKTQENINPIVHHALTNTPGTQLVPYGQKTILVHKFE